MTVRAAEEDEEDKRAALVRDLARIKKWEQNERFHTPAFRNFLARSRSSRRRPASVRVRVRVGFRALEQALRCRLSER